jgi:hypothetical protein
MAVNTVCLIDSHKKGTRSSADRHGDAVEVAAGEVREDAEAGAVVEESGPAAAALLKACAFWAVLGKEP